MEINERRNSVEDQTQFASCKLKRVRNDVSDMSEYTLCRVFACEFDVLTRSGANRLTVVIGLYLGTISYFLD